ncbi:alanine--tRNA ligase [Candidatus Saccharibacteria bacterium]|nr:alanine--tRNA ligase [Candidatus Saccharibacteria bacterium]
MNANEIREKYLKFMEERGHAVLEPAGLVPKDDPTTLFTGSGMQMLLPYLLGKAHPDGTRLTDSQPCLRAQDIEDVGDNRHTTCFEMLGNWSLGDYFKKEQIRWFWEFLTVEVGLDPERIYVTCFIGDEENEIPKDTEAAEIWKEIFEEAGVSSGVAEIGSADVGDERGMKEGERIFYYNDKENWWSRGGGIKTTPIGDPCGPDSEVFYDFGEENHDASYGKAHPASDSGRFIEIGNQVFMEYRRKEDGSFEPLKAKNVDFGGGLERIAAAAIGEADVFKTSLFTPVIEKLEEMSGRKYEGNVVSMRVIADHMKGAVWLAAQGLVPSNKEQGYVMRRLVRRAVAKALDLGIEEGLMEQMVPVVCEIYRRVLKEVTEGEAEILAVLVKEEEAFRKTLGRGLREAEKLAVNTLTVEDLVDGADLFKLQDTYGFPLELAVEMMEKLGAKLSDRWREEFEMALEKQRETSRTATKGMFKGGLEDGGEMTLKYHTVAHLVLAAMCEVLDAGVEQRGSNITAERMRFDFSWDEKLTEEQVLAIEGLVNGWIEADLPISFGEFETEVALGEMGAHGSFRDKYGETVTVYTVGEGDGVVSNEVCGGPHVERTGVLGEGGVKFKIAKQEASSAGVRRIKGILK